MIGEDLESFDCRGFYGLRHFLFQLFWNVTVVL
jgi:hypothetical protein